MIQSRYRFWKYLPFEVALFLWILAPTIHALESNTLPSRWPNQTIGTNRISPLREDDQEERRWVPIPRKNIEQAERMPPKNIQKRENTSSSILNGSCIGPTYGSNNFTWELPPGSSKTKISEPSKSTMHKKPPRMRRENREEIEKHPFWYFFK